MNQICLGVVVVLMILWPQQHAVVVPQSGGNVGPIQTQASTSPTSKSIDTSKIFGRIQFVSSFPDYRVKVVDSFPDLKVTKVNSCPDASGKWQEVNSFPDFKIQLVDSFPDFTIQYQN